jgi:hypothetical protein
MCANRICASQQSKWIRPIDWIASGVSVQIALGIGFSDTIDMRSSSKDTTCFGPRAVTIEAPKVNLPTLFQRLKSNALYTLNNYTHLSFLRVTYHRDMERSPSHVLPGFSFSHRI